MAGHRCARATFIMEAIVIATELFGAQEKLRHHTLGEFF